jgi:hypothetical protein
MSCSLAVCFTASIILSLNKMGNKIAAVKMRQMSTPKAYSIFLMDFPIKLFISND